MDNYTVIHNSGDLTREEWIQVRKKYIGGSDAGAILGVNPYRGAMDVWLDKNTDQTKDLESEAIRQGNDLEDYVAKRFSEATGLKVRRDRSMMVSVENPFMLADIDRRIVGRNAILECKTTAAYNGSQWDDGKVPPSYYAQVQHYIAVTGAETAFIAVAILGRDFKYYEIEPNDSYIRAMIEMEKDFYETSMERGLMPSPDGTKAASEAIKAFYKGGIPDTVDLSENEEAIDMAHDYLSFKAEKKMLEDAIRAKEQGLQMLLKNNEKGIAGDFEITWPSYTRKNFDKKAFEEDYPVLAQKYTTDSEYRRFGVKEMK